MSDAGHPGQLQQSKVVSYGGAQPPQQLQHMRSQKVDKPPFSNIIPSAYRVNSFSFKPTATATGAPKQQNAYTPQINVGNK